MKMWSPSTQRLIILSVVIIILIKYCFFSSKSFVKRNLERRDIFDKVVEFNSLWVDPDEEKKFYFYKQIPAFSKTPSDLAMHSKAKTVVCETDASIGQAILCKLRQQEDEEEPCDSDSLKHYKNFAEFKKSENVDKNLTDWKILFPRRDPIERLVDHFMDTCVREARPCFDCRLDLKCYLTIIHSIIKDLHKKIELLSEDHMKYIPQNWYCQMETMAQRMNFVDYESYAHPTNPQFADAKRPDKLTPEEMFEDPISSHEKIRQYYTTFIHARADLIDLVTKIYYWDYMLLKLPLPEVKPVENRDYKDGWH